MHAVDMEIDEFRRRRFDDGERRANKRRCPLNRFLHFSSNLVEDQDELDDEGVMRHLDRLLGGTLPNRLRERANAALVSQGLPPEEPPGAQRPGTTGAKNAAQPQISGFVYPPVRQSDIVRQKRDHLAVALAAGANGEAVRSPKRLRSNRDNETYPKPYYDNGKNPVPYGHNVTYPDV